jgi:hypothetical protein
MDVLNCWDWDEVSVTFEGLILIESSCGFAKTLAV